MISVYTDKRKEIKELQELYKLFIQTISPYFHSFVKLFSSLDTTTYNSEMNFEMRLIINA